MFKLLKRIFRISALRAEKQRIQKEEQKESFLRHVRRELRLSRGQIKYVRDSLTGGGINLELIGGVAENMIREIGTEITEQTAKRELCKDNELKENIKKFINLLEIEKRHWDGLRRLAVRVKAQSSVGHIINTETEIPRIEAIFQGIEKVNANYERILGDR